MNKYFLAARVSDGAIGPIIPIAWPLMPEEAVNLAAWLFVLAGCTQDKFDAEVKQAMES